MLGESMEKRVGTTDVLSSVSCELLRYQNVE